MVVDFVYNEWATRYPELECTVDQTLAELYFNEAGLYLNNTDCSMVPASPTSTPWIGQPRKLILYALTAHIAKLNGPGSSGLVGRISDATEGSVSVGTELDAPQSAAWFAQTPYGFNAWQMMAPYRTARYRASPGRFAQIPGNGPGYGYGPYGPYGPGGGGRGW